MWVDIKKTKQVKIRDNEENSLKSSITDSWNEYLDEYDDNQKDIYYSEEYVKLYKGKNDEALCALCKEADNILLLPYIRKEIDGFFDFETAYGYGGPIANTEDNEWINNALKEMKKLFERERYVCGFIRFHPLLNNAIICKNHMQVIFDRNTVFINTEMTEGEMWEYQITSKNRNMIRKAQKNCLEYKAEYDFESLPQFINLYNATMKRLGADCFYYFNDSYYQAFADAFKGKAFLGTVKKGNELICAALFMYSNRYGHYHLEGSNYTYSKLAANNLLLWKTALEFHDLGIKEFHLGGGYDSNPENSLFKFKKSFSNFTKDFYIGKWIFNHKKYMELKNEWADKNPDKSIKFGNLLLCYRY